MAVRAILLDEHTMLFREGLVSTLSSCEGGIEARALPEGLFAFALLRQNGPDVVITQIDEDLHRAKEEDR